jgi:hypothetical protein
LIGAEEVDEELGGFGVAGDVPPSAAQAQRTYWSLDSGDRSMSVEPVGFVLVQFVLVENDADVQPILDSVVAFDATYWRWLPIEIAGAATALESEWIPYEGEPDDEPEFNAVLARRDQLIVIVTAAGSDSDATDRAAASITEAVFERAGEISSDGGGSATTESSGGPLADAFADQLGRDAGFPWFQALDRADTECFAATALDTIGEQRQAEVRFAPDNIPLLFEADWTDTEIGALTGIFESCLDDDTKGTEAFLWTIFGPQASRYSDCAVSEITATSGERYWVQQFSASFSPPRVEEAREADPEAQSARTISDVYPELEPVLEECVPGYGDPVDYAEDACGGEPCEDEPDPPDPSGLRRVVLECSRDPYVNASFYAGVDEFLGFDDTSCEEQGRGTLIRVRMLAYPCPEGPRDIEITATGEPITEQAVTDACATTP